MQKLYIIIFNLLLVTACNQSDKLPKDPLDYFSGGAIPLTGKIIDTDKEILLGGDVKLLYDSILLVTNLRDTIHLSIVDIKNGKLLKQMIRQGVGPGELTNLIFVANSYADSLWICDPNIKMLHRIDVERAISETNYKTEKVFSYNVGSLKFFSVGEYFIGHGFLSDKRFDIYDKTGTYIKSTLQYPKPKQYSNIPDRVFATGFQGSYTVHPDNRHFAFAATSENINIYRLDGDSIIMTRNLNFNEPKMRRRGEIMIDSRESKIAFTGIGSTAQNIYVLYLGKELTLYSNVSDNLLVFDWLGNPVKKYKLDIPLFSMCINSDGTKMYGIAHYPETIIVQYDLE